MSRYSANNIKAVLCHVINHIPFSERRVQCPYCTSSHCQRPLRERELVYANKSVHKHVFLQLMLTPLFFTLHPLLLRLEIGEYISLVSQNDATQHYVIKKVNNRLEIFNQGMCDYEAWKMNFIKREKTCCFSISSHLLTSDV